MNIFSFSNYKEFIKAWLKASPKQGRGAYSRFAEVAQTHKATISQVFQGDKQLSLEQAMRIGQHIGLSGKELRYFLTMVRLERAGSADLRQMIQSELDEQKELHSQLENRLVQSRELSAEERAIFYSHWMYSAIRVLSSIPAYQTVNRISQRLQIPVNKVQEIADQLIATGLCKISGGKISPGPQSTFLGAKSPLVSRHHGNWRIKAMERHPLLNDKEELAYTAPLSLSSKDVLRIREILAQAIEDSDKIVGPSECERIFCLNVDWFEVF